MFDPTNPHVNFTEIYVWQISQGDNFRCKLFTLMCKADSENLRKLKGAFPEEGKMWDYWYSGEFQKDLNVYRQATA